MRPWLLRLGLAASLVALVLSLFVAWQVVRREWDPLGPYPEQTVEATAGHVGWKGPTDTDDVVTIPAVKLGEAMSVTGTKCADNTVTVHGSKGWTSRDPAGFSADEPGGVATRFAGCKTSTFENRMPPEVVEWARGQLARRPFVVLTIGGCETPADDNHNGKPECWTTEPFAVVEG